jgi:hypothetical protein
MLDDPVKTRQRDPVTSRLKFRQELATANRARARLEDCENRLDGPRGDAGHDQQ